MAFQDMKIKNYILLNELANLSLNVLKCMKIKVLNEKDSFKVSKNQGILSP